MYIRTSAQRGPALLGFALLVAACAGNDPGVEPSSDAGTDSALSSDAGTASRSDSATPSPDASFDVGSPDAERAPDAGVTLSESEPNDGATFDEVNELPPGSTIVGNIDVNDSDVFHVATEPGTLYEITISRAADSELEFHTTVIDDGRDEDPAGGDYVKISRGDKLRLLAMGTGGYYVAVRDARNVDGGEAGGPGHGYTLRVDEIPTADAVQGQVTFGGQLTGTLGHEADVHLWTFEGAEGEFVRFDFAGTGELDGRLYVFSEQTGSWIARQDDRTTSDPNPLLDAPLTAGGQMLLVVENISEQSSSLRYSVDATKP